MIGARWKQVARDALVLVALAVYASPFLWQALTSLRPEGELLVVPPWLPSRLTLEHYAAVLGRSVIGRALLNSAGIAALTTVAALALGVPAAYGAARRAGPGGRSLLLAMVAATALPAVAVVSPLYLLVRALGLRDTWAAVVLAHTGFALPLVVWLLAGFFREIPVAVEEAAELDGAGRWSRLRWVILPLAAPGVASAGVLTFLFSWNEFLFAYTFTATEASRTLPVALALFPGVFEVPWGDIAAASMLASVPPLLVVLALQRHLVRGLTAGAVRE